jgi:hypothetical protein
MRSERDGVRAVVGYSIIGYDVRSLSTGIVAETDQVDAQVREVRSSEVTSADLDAIVGAEYVRVVHGTLADALTAFQAAGERLAATLVSTYEQYERVDEDVATGLRGGPR